MLVETGAGRNLLSMAIQFSVVASAFQFLDGAVVVDDDSTDPENVVTYRQRDEFLRHAARAMRRLYDWNLIAHPKMLDGFWAELQSELKDPTAGEA